MNETFRQKAALVVKWLIRDFHLTVFQACGIVGNLGRESEGFAILREIGAPAGRGGYGWGQWTGSRGSLFLNWAHTNHLDWRSDEANYGYLKHELEGPYAFVIFHLRAAKTLDQAVVTFERFYERAGVPAMNDRFVWAEEALRLYNAANGGATADA